MAVQNNVQVTVAYKEETTFNTPPSASGAQLLRRVQSSLGPVKDSFTSNEVRSDFQVNDMRHGMRSARGSIDGELSPTSYTDFFAAALRGSWSLLGSITSTDFATGVTIANATVNGQNCSTLTFAGAGNLFTKGARVGDIVRLSGMTNPLNNSSNIGNVRIVALTATVMTVYPRLTATAQQAAGWTVNLGGFRLTMGTTKRSFTIEQSMADAALYEAYSGVRVNGFSLNVPPNGIATINWDLLGSSFNMGTAAAYFTSPTAETTSGLVAGIDGALRLNNEEQGVITGMQLNFTNNCSIAPVLGSTFAPDVFYGRMVVTGSVTAYLEDADLVNAFLNESEVDFTAVLETSGAGAQDFVAFNMQRIKFSGASKQITGDGGVVAQFPFQALLKAGGAGTGYDQTTLTIQRAGS